jgi:hypothetical protein
MLRTHPYLFANLPLLALLLAITLFARRRDLARLALPSGFLCLPASVLALMHQGEYWRPNRLGGGPFGIEDLIFTFSAGMAAWYCAAWPQRAVALPDRIVTWRSVKRTLIWGTASGALAFVLWRGGLDCMSATVMAAIPLLAALLVWRRRLWRLAFTGMVCFVPVYIALVNIQLAIWPDYLRQWSSGGWSRIILGMPVGEIAWAGAFGTVWPVLIASAFDIELETEGAPLSGL